MNLGCASAQCSRTQAARGLARQIAVAFEQATHALDILRCNQGFQIHGSKVAVPIREVALVVVDVRDSAAHAGGKVAAG